jgi:arylsulfatase A-like enzyme
MKKLVFGLLALFLLGGGAIVYLPKQSAKSNKTPLNNISQGASNLSNQDLVVNPSSTPIIIIDICSLRKDRISGFGYFRNTTPNLDAFMKVSDVFDNFWTEGNFCLPNFGTLLTGTRPDVHRLVLNGTGESRLSTSTETMAALLEKMGYKTAAFVGSRFLLPSTSEHSSGLDRGFQVYENHYNSEKFDEASFETNIISVNKWVDENKSSPFFLYVTVDDLHSPYMTDDRKMFDPGYKGVLDKMSPDINFDRVYNGEPVALGIEDIYGKGVKEFKKDPKNLKFLNALYDASVVRTDRLVGEFFKKLKESGLWDKAIIIVTVHQGEQLGEHGLLGHTQGLYNPVLAVPLFIKYPGQLTSTHFSQLVERIDIPATVLDEAGILGNHKQFTGKSLLPLLKDSSSVWQKPYIFASTKPVKFPVNLGTSIEERAVRNDRYKLIWSGYKEQPYELYDLKDDPGETTNLVSSLPQVFNELKDELDKYIHSFSN